MTRQWKGAPFKLSSTTEKGDANGDGSVSITDVTTLINVILTGLPQNTDTSIYDFNGDGDVTVSDVTGLVDMILNENTSQTYHICPDDHHPHMIDLGLPSGTKWACCNVGANNPEEYGGYYAWGETKEKDMYNDVTYPYIIGADTDADGWYDNDEQYQSIGTNISGTQYDVAYVEWGGSWLMPSWTQFHELVDNCTYEWTTVNDVKGELFTGLNGCSIFLPAAGFRYDDNISNNNECVYRSSTHNPNWENRVYDFYIANGNLSWGSGGSPSIGKSIRPVISDNTLSPLRLSSSTLGLVVKEQVDVMIVSGNGNYTVKSNKPSITTATIKNETITITGISVGTATITVTDTKTNQTAFIETTVTEATLSYLTCPDDNHPHMIDLGLPSGTKWSCCNVGATIPKDNGGYYAWGEIEEKDVYDEVTYQYCTGWDENGDGIYEDLFWHNLGSDIAGTQYDVAHMKWGGSWVMPSFDQIHELQNNCTYTWTTLNDVIGGQFTGPNGGCIFLPASGGCFGNLVLWANSRGLYWSATQKPSDSDFVGYLDFYSNYPILYWCNDRWKGCLVRPVWVP